jgi:hypothetical protein
MSYTDTKVHEKFTNSKSFSTPIRTPSKSYSSPYSYDNMNNNDDYLLNLFPEFINTLRVGNILRFSYLNPCSFNCNNQFVNNDRYNSFASQVIIYIYFFNIINNSNKGFVCIF